MPIKQTIKEFRDLYSMNKEEILKDFYTFLRFPSISTDPEYKQQTMACADWLQKKIEGIGFEVEMWPTEGYPVIFATNLQAGPGKPTLLIYNHYDVQPVDPLDLWASPPFEPQLKDGEIYARGAQDNKGQCFYVFLALKALMEQNKTLPINIKWCIEGEEEIGSGSLSKVLDNPDRCQQLKSDYLVVVDVGLEDKYTPAVTLGVRGMVTMELRAQGSNMDLHSGSYGGIVYNPLHALVELLSSVRGPDGKILIPGFYDDIEPISKQELNGMDLKFDDKTFEAMFDAKPTGGEKTLSPWERAFFRPTLEINGIVGGYGGKGFKTIIPAKAIAKVSCRLVPNQNPEKIGQLLVDYFKKHAPEGITIEVEIFPGIGRAIRVASSSQIVKAFSQAYSELFGKPCKHIYTGASIPIITKLAEASGSEVVLMGFGLPDDSIHAPNEHFGVDRLEQGFLVITRAIEILVGDTISLEE